MNKKAIAIALAAIMALGAYGCKPKDAEVTETPTQTDAQPTPEVTDAPIVEDKFSVDPSELLSKDELIRSYISLIGAGDYIGAQAYIWPYAEKLAGYEPGTYTQSLKVSYEEMGYKTISGRNFVVIRETDQYTTYDVEMIFKTGTEDVVENTTLTVVYVDDRYYISVDNILCGYENNTAPTGSELVANTKRALVTSDGLVLAINVHNGTGEAIELGKKGEGEEGDQDARVILEGEPDVPPNELNSPEQDDETSGNPIGEGLDEEGASAGDMPIFDSFIPYTKLEAGSDTTCEAFLSGPFKSLSKVYFTDVVIGGETSALDVSTAGLTIIPGGLADIGPIGKAPAAAPTPAPEQTESDSESESESEQ